MMVRVFEFPSYTTSLRLNAVATIKPRVAPYGPTLGYGSESRWDSKLHLNSYKNQFYQFYHRYPIAGKRATDESFIIRLHPAAISHEARLTEVHGEPDFPLKVS
jgi:hypothetical protein